MSMNYKCVVSSVYVVCIAFSCAGQWKGRLGASLFFRITFWCRRGVEVSCAAKGSCVKIESTSPRHHHPKSPPHCNSKELIRREKKEKQRVMKKSEEV